MDNGLDNGMEVDGIWFVYLFYHLCVLFNFFIDDDRKRGKLEVKSNFKISISKVQGVHENLDIYRDTSKTF